jgi:hypothetical protein
LVFHTEEGYDNNGYSKKRNVRMSEIANDWASPPCSYLVRCLQLLLWGLQSSSRKVGFKKCAKEGSISRSGKTGGSKSGKSSSANAFSGSIGPAKKPQA